jgi:membrane carboxypeptidase/penicillin-binding protein
VVWIGYDTPRKLGDEMASYVKAGFKASGGSC